VRQSRRGLTQRVQSGASTDTSSQLALRRLGAQLRGLRERAGKTHEDVQITGIAGRTKMWRIEHGKVAAKPGDVWALGRLYNVPIPRIEQLVELAEAARHGPYWEDFDRIAVPDWLGIYAELERSASRMATWEPTIVTGLLQTPAYTRATMEVNVRLDARRVEERVRFRLARQSAVFERDEPPRITVIQGVGSLILQVGSPEVMAEQVAHLRDLQGRGLAEVLVLPAAAGAYAALSTGFTILDFDHADDPTAVYAEIPLGGHYYETAEQVDEMRWALEQLRAHSITIEEYRP
jgi:hypothetical protein